MGGGGGGGGGEGAIPSFSSRKSVKHQQGKKTLQSLSCLLSALALLFSGVEPFWQFWYKGIRGTYKWNYFEIGPLATEEMSFITFSTFSSSDHSSAKLNHFSIFGKRGIWGTYLWNFVCLCWGFTAQSTQWSHVKRGQFTLPHVYWAGLVSKRLTSIVHILLPETDNCPSWISGRVRMTVENISWSISTKEWCWPRRGLNLRPPGLQSDGTSNWATEAGICEIILKSGHCPRRSHLKVFLVFALAVILFSRAEPF